MAKSASVSLKFVSALTLGLAVLSVSVSEIKAQSFSKTFPVDADTSELEVINQIGSIKVTASSANTGKIIINARKVDGDAQVSATQNPQGKVTVEVKGRGVLDFEITVPPSSKLDLFTYKGTISVANLTGQARARITTIGNIQFTGIRSAKVEAHSVSGNVIFSGEILPNGDYTLKSFSGRVEVILPASSDFTLSASSFSGVIDLGGFPMRFSRQTNQLVEASCGTGRAKVLLWTKEGSIHLRRRP